MKYQADNAWSLGTEWDFNAYKCWFVDAVGGGGWAFPTFSDLPNATTVINYGIGFRYLMAKKYGILSGVDFAFTKQGDFAFYIIMGHAWRR